jgi:hypothetical protein
MQVSYTTDAILTAFVCGLLLGLALANGWIG